VSLKVGYQGFTKQKTTIELEHYRPPGEDGIAITIRYSGKLTAKGVELWRPIGRATAILGVHIRERVRDKRKGPTGRRLGPGKVSGKMWDSLSASITASGRARLYFRGQSESWYNTSTGPKKRKDSMGKPVKVKNVNKAQNVAGLGMTFKRDAHGRMMMAYYQSYLGDPKDTDWVRYGRAWIPRGFDPPRDSRGRWTDWPEYAKEPKPTRVPQRFASGGHNPTNFLEPTAEEVEAVVSVLSLGVERAAMPGYTVSSSLRGDARLISKLRRGLGV